MGKSRKQKNMNKKVERDTRTNDVIVLNKGESGKNGDPLQGKDVTIDLIDSVDKNRKLVSYQDMDFETENDLREREREINRPRTESVREGIEQDSAGKTVEGNSEKGTKMVRYEGRMRYVEDIKNYPEIMKNQNRKVEEARFNNSHKGKPIIEAILDPRVR